MATFDRIDINKKRTTPIWIKLVLLAAVIFGLYIRSCWIKNVPKQLKISNIEIKEVTSSNIDITFKITNHTEMTLEKNLLIQIYSPKNVLIASKITPIKIESRVKNKQYLKQLTKFNQPVNSKNDIGDVNVEIYVLSFLN